jgi:hypothetical protein
MSRGPGLQELELPSMERERLLEWTRRHKSAQALALRSRIVLAAAEGHTNGAMVRGGRGFSDTGVSGNLPEQYSNRRAQIHEETKT